jgi:hypothetical protein
MSWSSGLRIGEVFLQERFVLAESYVQYCAYTQKTQKTRVTKGPCKMRRDEAPSGVVGAGKKHTEAGPHRG